jgi:hypothetical protein
MITAAMLKKGTKLYKGKKVVTVKDISPSGLTVIVDKGESWEARMLLSTINASWSLTAPAKK